MAVRAKARKKRYVYTAVIERETDPAFEGYYNAYVPALPGCVSYGKSFEEAVRNIKEAIASYLLSLKDAGERIPPNVKPDIETVGVEVVL